MTNEEAIQELKSEIEWSKLNLYPYISQRKVEAINMAIKALEQESIIDRIRAEIEQTEINGHIRDVECFRAGINIALNVIDKYKAEIEPQESESDA